MRKKKLKNFLANLECVKFRQILDIKKMFKKNTEIWLAVKEREREKGE
jgi:hypothetical protein